MSRLFPGLWIALSISLAVASPPPPPAGALADLAHWTEGFLRDRQRAEPAEAGQRLDRILTIVREGALRSQESRREALLGVLQLSAAGSAVADEGGERYDAAAAVVDRAQREGRVLADASTLGWLAGEVLVAESRPEGVRAAAARLLAGASGDDVLFALSVATRDGSPVVRAAAAGALVGRRESFVQSVFVRLLGAEDRSGRVTAAIEEHFHRVSLDVGDRAEAGLAAWVGERLLAEDWRSAALAVSVSRALADARAVPWLIEALEVWLERAAAGAPVRRLAADVVRELERRSGRSLGLVPARWRSWWAVVQSGAHVAHDTDAERTQSTFFGLRPVTDRVVFVIDRSGSMATAAAGLGRSSAAGHWSRYDEAVSQMIDCLKTLGPAVRFDVVLFSDSVEVWRDGVLCPATASSLRAARKFCLRRKPRDGTYLRPAFERALKVRKDGTVDLERLEADTVIVLCDGGTSEGSAWVEPVLARVHGMTRVVVHAVQIGDGGDGTLEELASGTGGDFVRVR